MEVVEIHQNDVNERLVMSATYPVNIIFFSIILSASMLLKEPTAATVGALPPSPRFKTIKGRGGNEIGA
ncbi:hypothetical protein JCGZ_08107 [Jatropha curcas]|uniref:Transmembrane protein n=1 Tax=Jatropha curcas TaxID=180498 RepID=A0A067KKQ9_JATCU|nr:hypothetical protein JCGZ_08107 [Jatropha curcas]